MTTQLHTAGLEIVVEELGDLTLVVLSGALDIYTAPYFRRDVERHAGAGEVVVDLSAVTLIDSAGLGALVRLRNRARRDGPGPLGLVCPRRRLRRVFEITGLREEFVIASDLEGVRAALSGRARTTARR